MTPVLFQKSKGLRMRWKEGEERESGGVEREGGGCRLRWKERERRERDHVREKMPRLVW